MYSSTQLYISINKSEATAIAITSFLWHPESVLASKPTTQPLAVRESRPVVTALCGQLIGPVWVQPFILVNKTFAKFGSYASCVVVILISYLGIATFSNT